ncbi:MAG: DUF2905 domain-containing protein [Synergistaceae bacterium]|jgi:hypothetical protein|nr:DUF2905 domain-containing protein [Synergistaceae bacterium]
MSDFSVLAKLIFGVGLFLTLLGASLLLLCRFSLPLGRLPGDFLFVRENVRIYIPITSTVIVSGILSLVAYFFRRFLS